MKKNKFPEKPTYGKYLFAGVLTAAIIVVIISLTGENDIPKTEDAPHIWAAETDSMFVKDCYNKYKPQVKDDLVKQETMKLFCRCMLEKIKSKYEETDLDLVTESDIKKWDTECRDKISNSNFLK